MSHRLRRTCVLVASAVLAAALASALMSLGTNASAQDPSSAAPAPDSRLAGRFALLRRPVSAADAVPARWRKQLEAASASFTSSEGAPDFDAARKVTSSVGATFWVVPRGSSVCVLEVAGDGAGFGCSTVADVLAGRSYSVSSGIGYGLAEGETRISGLVPDGASEVAVVTRDGSSRSVAVQQNLYVAVVRGETDHVGFVDAQDTRRTVPVRVIGNGD